MTASYSPYNQGITLSYNLNVTPIRDRSESSAGVSKELTDQELVQRIQNTTGRSRENAFTMLYTRHYHNAEGVARRVLQNPSDIEDVVDDAFFKVHKAIDRFRGDSAFSTWFYRIVRNTAINFKSSQDRKPNTATLTDEAVEARVDALHPAQSSPSREQSIGEIERVIQDGMLLLTPELSETLNLVVRDGLSYEKVAEVTQVPIGTVRSRVFRARQHLAEFIESKLPGFAEAKRRLKQD